MSMAKIKRPEGHHTITPGFSVENATKVLDFLQKSFGGKVVDRFDGPNGAIMHCEVMIGDSVVMFGEATPEMGPMPASLSLISKCRTLPPDLAKLILTDSISPLALRYNPSQVLQQEINRARQENY